MGRRLVPWCAACQDRLSSSDAVSPEDAAKTHALRTGHTVCIFSEGVPIGPALACPETEAA
jgi:hypothetical protein